MDKVKKPTFPAPRICNKCDDFFRKETRRQTVCSKCKQIPGGPRKKAVCTVNELVKMVKEARNG